MLVSRRKLPFELPPSLWPAVGRRARLDRWPPESPEEADRFVHAAAAERLLPLAFADERLPDVVRQGLGRAAALRRAFELRSAALDRTLRRSLELLEGEPAILLKGSDYRHRLYPQPWLRPMQDVDLLVPRGGIDAVGERLRSAGIPEKFPAGPVSRLASYHERVFELPEASLEVHHSFAQRVRYRVDYDGVWTRRRPLAIAGVAAERLGDADALLYHAVSLALDEFAAPVIRFLDFWLLLRVAPPALAEAAARAARWGARHALFGALEATQRILGELPGEDADRIRDGLLSPPVRAFLRTAVLGRSEPSAEKLPRARQLWRKFWLIGGFPRRAAFAAYHAYASLAGRLAPRR